MLHTNVAELWLLGDIFTRVWSSGGQANLSLETKDCQMWAKLTSSWALLTATALELQWLEGGQEQRLGTTRNILPVTPLKHGEKD